MKIAVSCRTQPNLRRGTCHDQNLFSLTIILLLACLSSNDINAAEWAGMGECDNNPGYMLSNCEDSCQKHAEAALREAEDIKVRFVIGMCIL